MSQYPQLLVRLGRGPLTRSAISVEKAAQCSTGRKLLSDGTRQNGARKPSASWTRQLMEFSRMWSFSQVGSARVRSTSSHLAGGPLKTRHASALDEHRRRHPVEPSCSLNRPDCGFGSAGVSARCTGLVVCHLRCWASGLNRCPLRCVSVLLRIERRGPVFGASWQLSCRCVSPKTQEVADPHLARTGDARSVTRMFALCAAGWLYSA